MTDQSSLFPVKPVITYPREAEIGRTYLMTIDLQPEGEFNWHYSEEEYPVYCNMNSDSFIFRSIGESVILLHRFGYSYKEAEFLLTATQEEKESIIEVSFISAWGFVFGKTRLKVNIVPISNRIELSQLQPNEDMKTHLVAAGNTDLKDEVTARSPEYHSENWQDNVTAQPYPVTLDHGIAPDNEFMKQIHDTENIIKAFNQLLLSRNKPLLTQSQKTVLAWCLEYASGSYQDIAAASHYTTSSLQSAGSKLFGIIRSVLGKRVTKKTCGWAVRNWYKQKEYYDTRAIGREADLQTLMNAITVEGRRVICI